MRCLITGGAGFIGSFLADHLLAQGHAVVLYDNLCAQVHPHGKPDYLNAAANLIVGDVRDRTRLAPWVRQADYIVHLAAAVGLGQSNYEIRHYCDVNVTGTATLCDILANESHSVRKVIVAGSMAEYGEGLYRRASDGARLRPAVRTEESVRKQWEPCDPRTGEVLTAMPTPESESLNGLSVYAQTKRLQEELVLNLDRLYGVPALTLRFFNVYGPRQSLSNPYTGVLAIFLAQLMNGKPPRVCEDGRQTRDFVYVADVARIVAHALEHPAHAVRINLGSGAGTAIGDLAQWLCRQLRPELTPAITGAFRKGDIRHCTADISLLREILGVAPAVTPAQGIGELLLWAAKQKPDDNTAQAWAELARHGLAPDKRVSS